MPSVLVVEDEFLVREFIVEEFGDAGFAVQSASDGEKALELLKSGAGFDLLFTDVRMPGSIDGWELGRHAAQMFPDIRIVYATGYSETSHALNDNEGFLTKPYRMVDILELIGGLGIRV
ncbi:MAG: response regulator [Pseudomonadota bacterium]|nr:response regulator [Pseudomonadota bacterium]